MKLSKNGKGITTCWNLSTASLMEPRAMKGSDVPTSRPFHLGMGNYIYILVSYNVSHVFFNVPPFFGLVNQHRPDRPGPGRSAPAQQNLPNLLQHEVDEIRFDGQWRGPLRHVLALFRAWFRMWHHAWHPKQERESSISWWPKKFTQKNRLPCPSDDFFHEIDRSLTIFSSLAWLVSPSSKLLSNCLQRYLLGKVNRGEFPCSSS